MNTIFDFLDGLSSFFNKITAFDILPGVDLFTLLFYNFLLVIMFTALARR